VSIYRKEVYLQIQEANKEAAQNTASVAELENLLK
jgi:sRNA-binding carbon storage regulator CsrA